MVAKSCITKQNHGMLTTYQLVQDSSTIHWLLVGPIMGLQIIYPEVAAASFSLKSSSNSEKII